MEIKELYELYGITKDDFRFFYDTKTNNFIPIAKEYVDLMEQDKLLDESNYPKEDQDVVKLLHYYQEHSDELIYFPTVDMFDIINAKDVFIRELDEDMRPQFDYLKDSKEDLEEFLTKVESMNLVKRWEKNYNDQIEQRVNDWIHANGIKGIFNKDYRIRPLKILKKISKLEPWKIFKNKELIKIQVGKVCFYIAVLGKNREYQGLVIYPGESGLNDYEMINNVSLDNGEPPLINMALQNSIACSFSKYEELDEDDKELIDQSNLKFYKNKYPSIKLFKEGCCPTSEIDEETLHLVSSILEILYNGILECINTSLLDEMDEDELLLVDLNENDIVTIDKWRYEPSETINNYGLDIEPRPSTCFLDDTLNYEVKVDVIKSPLTDGFTRLYIFSLFVVDLDSGLIVFNTQSYYDQDNQALPQLAKELGKFAEKNDFATNVVVSDFISEMLVVSAVGDDVEINYQAPSSYMEEIFDQMNSLTRELNDDDDEVDYSTLN